MGFAVDAVDAVDAVEHWPSEHAGKTAVNIPVHHGAANVDIDWSFVVVAEHIHG